VQERKKNAAQEKENPKATQRKSGFQLSSVLILIFIAVGGTYFYTSRTPDTPKTQAQTTQNTQRDVATDSRVKEPIQGTPIYKAQRTPAQGNVIEMATQATVSIETPFGTGSGFFINDEWIITNRHVIEIDAEMIKDAQVKYTAARRFTDLEEEKLRDYRKKLYTLPEGPAKSQLAMIIEGKENELMKALEKLKNVEEKLDLVAEPIQASDIKIIVADGNEYHANFLLVSDNYDLAILSLFATNHTKLRGAPIQSLHQGDKVYTIGSPVGLRHTVTAGVFSGYRKTMRDGHILLQTDAPINPGNSGGPLIDENGFVHGVNTSILANTEGIGFAIPIKAVFDEFASTIQ
jgi:S1-C subfamily serine protease